MNGTTAPHAEASRDQGFWDLVAADRGLLRAEFDALIAANWPGDPPPTAPHPPAPHPGAQLPPIRRTAPPAASRPAHTATRQRQRSPPGIAPTGRSATRPEPCAPGHTGPGPHLEITLRQVNAMIPSLPLHFTVSTEPGGIRVLHVRGEVDLATADRLRERLLAEYARHPRLVVDLSGAMLFDDAALRALHALSAKAAETHREPPVLRGVRPLLARMLKITGLRDLFTLEPARPAPRRPALSAGSPSRGAGQPRRGGSTCTATVARATSAVA